MAEIVLPSEAICTLAQAVRVSCLSSKADCKSVWLDNVQVIFHHSALVCVFEITLLFEIDIQGPAVYVVSVAEIVLPSAAIWIFVQAISASCFQLQVVRKFVLSAKSFISKSLA
jgi:hypothetical protein